MVNIGESLARASKTLILREPFYGLFLVGLNKVFRNDIPTAGVSKNGIGVRIDNSLKVVKDAIIEYEN